MTDEKLTTDVSESDGVLTVTVEKNHTFRDFDGETTEAPVAVAEVRVAADEDIAEALGHALLGWHVEKQPTGPPGQKPMHQQYAGMEPDR